MNVNLTTKREAAEQVLRELFSRAERIAIADAVKAAAERGVSRSTLTKVAHAEVGVTEIHNGPHGAFWELKR